MRRSASSQRESRKPLGRQLVRVHDETRQAFLGDTTFTEVPTRDEWGTWASAYVPLRDPDGRIEASRVRSATSRAYSSVSVTASSQGARMSSQV